VVIHPGWVQTDMGGDHAAIMPGESASGIIDVTDRLTPEQSSKFLTWDGRDHVW